MTLRWILASLALVAAIPAQGESSALDIRAFGVPTEVAFGDRIELTIEREWTRDLEPESFDTAPLLELGLRSLSIERRQDDERVHETERFAGRVTRLGRLVIPALLLRARPIDGGPERAAPSDEIVVAVRTGLPVDDSGHLERLEVPTKPRRGWRLFAGGALALGASVALICLRRRPVAAPLAPPLVTEPVVAPASVALARFEELERRLSAGDSFTRLTDDLVETSRVYLDAAGLAPTGPRNTLEIVRDFGARVTEPTLRALLDDVLLVGERIRYGRAPATRSVVVGMLEAAKSLVRATETLAPWSLGSRAEPPR